FAGGNKQRIVNNTTTIWHFGTKVKPAALSLGLPLEPPHSLDKIGARHSSTPDSPAGRTRQAQQTRRRKPTNTPISSAPKPNNPSVPGSGTDTCGASQ